MSGIEKLLRGAYQDAARTIKEDGIRPAVLLQPARRDRRFTAFAPAAAAVAVVAIIAGAIVLPHLLAAAGPAGSALAGQRFIAVLASSKHSSAEELLIETAEARDVTGVVAPPAGMAWESVARAGNSATFVAAATDSRACTSRLYYITPSRTGQPDGLVPVPMPVIAGAISYATALAVSADGKTVAYASTPRGPAMGASGQLCGFGKAVISVAVAGSPARQRTLPSEILPYDLSLSDDGSLLSYIADTADPAVGRLEGLWLVRTQGPGRTLPAGRQLLADTGRSFAAAGVLSGNDNVMYAVTFPPGNTSTTTFTLSEYRTADGAVQRTVHAWPASMMSPRSFSVTGNQLLFVPYYPPDTGYRLDLRSGRATSFPLFVPPDYGIFAVAW
jgi:hypothetical protein